MMICYIMPNAYERSFPLTMKIFGKSTTYGLQGLVIDVLRANPAAELTNADLVALLAQAPGMPPDRTEVSRCLARLTRRGAAQHGAPRPAPPQARGGRRVLLTFRAAVADT